MLCFFFLLSHGRIAEITLKELNVELAKSEMSFVLFKSDSRLSKVAENLFKSVPKEYVGDSEQIVVTADTQNLSEFHINRVPSIVVMRDGKPLTAFNGKFEEQALQKYFQSFSDTRIIDVTASFELFRIISLNPVVYVSTFEKDTSPHLYALNVRIPIELLEELHIRNNKLFVHDDYIDFDDSYFPRYFQVFNDESIDTSSNKYTLFALLNTHKPSQRQAAFDTFKYVSAKMKDKVVLEYGDFFDLPNTVSKLGIAKFKQPVYVLVSNVNGTVSLQACKRRSMEPSDIYNWIQKELGGSQKTVRIPQLKAAQFEQVAFDPNFDTIILMGHPKQPTYIQSTRNFEVLMEVFAPFKTVKFYELNTKKEIVEGLTIPNNKSPLISIWRAIEPAGTTMPADADIALITEHVIQLISTQFTESQLTDMAEALERLVKEL